MKQTAVKWLMNQMLEASIDRHTAEMYIKLPKDAFTKAKAMEKEQIFEAFKTGTKMIDVENEFDALFNAIIYYKETYESNT